MKRPPRSDFSKALRYARAARGLTQEDFEEVDSSTGERTTSRVYISALERGIKQPTLPKVDDLAAVVGVHPLTLLALSYSSGMKAEAVRKLCAQVVEEVAELGGAPE